MKLADLLRPVIPTIEQDMEAAGKMFESIDVTVDPQEDSPRATLAALLASYITQAANVLQGAPFSVDQLLSILDGLDLPESIDDLTVRRGLFRAVDSRIEEYAGVALSRDDAARLRQEVVGQPPGMNSGVAASTAPVVTEPAAEMTESAQRVIDTEIVAIYW